MTSTAAHIDEGLAAKQTVRKPKGCLGIADAPPDLQHALRGLDSIRTLLGSVNKQMAKIQSAIYDHVATERAVRMGGAESDA